MRRLACSTLIFALLGAAAPSLAAPMRVLVSIPPQKYLAERVGGERIEVITMLRPGHAPETFEPSPRQIADLGGATLYFRIGVPFERAWIEPFATGNPALEIVDCCRALESLSAQDGNAGGDPHIWVNPLNAIDMADLMCAELGRIDPAHRDYYSGNLAALRAELLRLHADIQDALSMPRTRYFIISHGSLGPFADTYGLVQIALEAGGHSVGPRQLAEIVQRARTEGIRAILVQKQFSLAPARTLAAELDAQLIEVDPLAEDYIAGMRAIAAAVAAATH
ncbi:MAG: zinc ABC transporter substrate-binding protein [Gammaproteobacteria bacterium]|nr:zinc ABC transporter substrate-binding protein [Gammaproteobacteria bacterium]